ncbi:hypothetical protein SAMN05660461_5970 [Chitinophaga ginsengisegetis]|uniref:Uncharacterized protein n=1 Tax=Chitinophaga ginsengisegetis TaxID=393003 RepID=A0A1T5PBE9_9BACT|nr:hypothetical protein SAMN05660461_5970 [Chitinophaga ginsengisegetis]
MDNIIYFMFTKDQIERLIAALETIGENMGKTNLIAPQSTSASTLKTKKGRPRKVDIQSQFKTHFQKKYTR